MRYPLLKNKVSLPEVPTPEDKYVVWIYADDEPAIQLEFSTDGQDLILDVTPMHMSGVEAQPTRIVAQ